MKKATNLANVAKDLSKEKLFTKEELADYLGISERTLYRYIKKYKITHIELPDQTRMYKESEVSRLLGVNIDD